VVVSTVAFLESEMFPSRWEIKANGYVHICYCYPVNGYWLLRARKTIKMDANFSKVCGVEIKIRFWDRQEGVSREVMRPKIERGWEQIRGALEDREEIWKRLDKDGRVLNG
jgi:hypothetical protein